MKQELTELYKRVSHDRLSGEYTTFRILAGKGGRYFYASDPEILRRDRLIFIELSRDGESIAFPFSIPDQERMWEYVFDVWVKETKIVNYAKRFLKLIYRKLLQRKLEGFAKAYWKELDKESGGKGNPGEQ